MAVGSRRVIAGVSGSLRSLGALRAGMAEARSSGAALLAVLAWAPAGGEAAYLRAPCPLLLRLWQRAAQERMREAFDAAFGRSFSCAGLVMARSRATRAAHDASARSASRAVALLRHAMVLVAVLLLVVVIGTLLARASSLP